ncbi:MAG: hypothetical protein Q9170_007237 [Blastenia crenularia]
MSSNDEIRPRQIWANPTPTSTALPRHCTPFRLPSGGLLAIGDGSIVTLTQEAVFQPYCTSKPEITANASSLESIGVDHKDPFYASTLPQMYAIAAVTVVSYLLVIMLFITPRTFFVGGSGGGGGFLGQRGMISGASGSTSVIGVGGRPWLQKVAALTVAISLTIASVDTFRVAERQYAGDYSDAEALTNEVVNSLELRIVRVVSETFLWLAQAQTLIRLFPRHKEKVIIKWAGFVLIALDTIFSILNNFVSGSARSAPRRFQDAVPALSYLFTFCLSLIYAAWIIYYSLSKRRYAFFHPKMRNICLVALLSYVAVLIPVVFFILDISIYDVAGWGNYVRWVGAAAASVVVWEWVERIEALERDERKDGILGREIFDGDEMLEITPSSAMTWSSSHRFGGNGGNDSSPPNTNVKGIGSIAQIINRTRRGPQLGRNRTSRAGSLPLVNEHLMAGEGHNASIRFSQPTPPTTEATPFSTMGPTRPESSVSSGHLHQVNGTSPTQQYSSESGYSEKSNSRLGDGPKARGSVAKSSIAKSIWDTMQRISISFLNRHMSPPLEVKQAVRSSQQAGPVEPVQTPSQPPVLFTRGLFDRIGLKKTMPVPKAPLPVTIVPAPSRNDASWNEVRLHGGNAPLSHSLSHHALGTKRHSSHPTNQLSRRSTPIADLASNRYSPMIPVAHPISPSPSVTLPQVAQPFGNGNVGSSVSKVPREGGRPLPEASYVTSLAPTYEGDQANTADPTPTPPPSSSFIQATHEASPSDTVSDMSDNKSLDEHSVPSKGTPH